MKIMKYVVNASAVNLPEMARAVNKPWPGLPNTRIVDSEFRLKRTWWLPWFKYWEITHTVEFVK